MIHPPEPSRRHCQMEKVEVDWTRSPKTQENGTIEFQSKKGQPSVHVMFAQHTRKTGNMSRACAKWCLVKSQQG